MARSRLSAALAVAVALAAPSAAFAGSAGDNQYSDPFGGNAPNTSTTPAATPPSQPAATQPQPQSSAAPASTTATNPSGQLPRTGLDLRLAAGVGVLLLGSGLLLRRGLARR
jgi:hypothetical protein